MKFIYALLMVCIASNYSYCQSYKSLFGEESTTWTIKWQNMEFGGVELLSVMKDTIVDGKSYKKLDYFNSGPSGPCLLREDTILGKVWMRYYFGSYPYTEEELVYDFSLNVGDSFNISHMITGYSDLNVATVDSIKWIEGRKYIYFNSEYHSWDSEYPTGEPFTFIEGIGTNMGPVWKQYFGGYRSHYLMCSTMDGLETPYENIRYYGECPAPPDSSTSLANISEKSFNVFPNPAITELNINGLTGAEKISLYSMDGRCVALFTDSTTSLVNIRYLVPGIYILCIQSKDGSKFFEKITII